MNLVCRPGPPTRRRLGAAGLQNVAVVLALSFKGATFVLVLELLLEGADSEALKPLGLTPEAIAAKVESLRITFSQWHVEMKPERQAAILQEAFGGAV